MTVLWHKEQPIGICVFTSPPLSLRHRNRFFGLSNSLSRVSLQALNAQLVTLSRVVVHPVYRGAGIATRFVRKSCQQCPFSWIESLAQMGNVNPFLEKAGFLRVGKNLQKIKPSRKSHSFLYGGISKRHGKRKRLISKETNQKSRFAQPVYYIFDNREIQRQRNKTP